MYHGALAVTAIAGLVGNFAAGVWADRGSLRRVLIAALLLMTGALVALPHVSMTAYVIAQAVAMGGPAALAARGVCALSMASAI